MTLDPTKISQAFDAGNFAAGYQATDLRAAMRQRKQDGRGDYFPAFVLGFFSSYTAHEIPADCVSAYLDSYDSAAGRACVAAGYVDALEDSDMDYLENF